MELEGMDGATKTQPGVQARGDETGVDLPNLDADRAMAVRFLSECLQVDHAVVWQGKEFRVEVTDDRGLLLFYLAVSGADAPAAR